VKLGRAGDNDIIIDSGSVSGKHAEMHRVDGGYELEDLGSTNGLKYSGARHHKLPLKSGMAVKVGDAMFEFTLSDEELASLAEEIPSGESPITKEPEFDGPAKLPDIEPRQEKERKSEPEPEPEPKPKRNQRREPAPVRAPQSALGSLVMVVLFLLLAAAAFYTGLSIRHKKETGDSLIKSIVNKEDVVGKDAPADAPPSEKE
jgi:predicted component of type VI protein secretion system